MSFRNITCSYGVVQGFVRPLLRNYSHTSSTADWFWWYLTAYAWDRPDFWQSRKLPLQAWQPGEARAKRCRSSSRDGRNEDPFLNSLTLFDDSQQNASTQQIAILIGNLLENFEHALGSHYDLSFLKICQFIITCRNEDIDWESYCLDFSNSSFANLSVLIDVLLPLRIDVDADPSVRGLVSAATTCLGLLPLSAIISFLINFSLGCSFADGLRLAEIVDHCQTTARVSWIQNLCGFFSKFYSILVNEIC